MERMQKSIQIYEQLDGNYDEYIIKISKFIVFLLTKSFHKDSF